MTSLLGKGTPLAFFTVYIVNSTFMIDAASYKAKKGGGEAERQGARSYNKTQIPHELVCYVGI